uniref:Uncharacterized protein n=1 Tax=Romanomermis culicivorax TaxID=13658 RepID=A0A915JRH8_ROMCU
MRTIYFFAAITIAGFSQAAFLWFAPSTGNEYARFKRDLATQKENNCTLSCLEEMDDTFNKTYNASGRTYWNDEKYDEKLLDKLCK